MQRFLIQFFLVRPLATVALGTVILLAAASASAWAYKRGKELPQSPTPVTLSDVEAHANGGQWLRIDGAPIRCERAVFWGQDAYVALGPDSLWCVRRGLDRSETLRKALRIAGRRRRPLGLREALAAALRPAASGEAASRPHRGHGGYPRLHPDLSLAACPFMVMGGYLIIWGLRQRSRPTPQTTDVTPNSWRWRIRETGGPRCAAHVALRRASSSARSRARCSSAFLTEPWGFPRRVPVVAWRSRPRSARKMASA